MKKIWGLSNSQLLGCFFIIIFSFSFLDLLKMYFSLSKMQYFTFYFILYFVGGWVVEKITNIAFLASLEQKYSFSLFLTYLVFIFDIVRNKKKLKIYSLLQKGVDVETLSKYFEDKDNHIQYMALLLYADIMSINPVLKWFEEKYTSKNLPIDEYFLPVYEYCLEKQNYA